ncbi:hypothetical protein F5Y19DRAFT_469607 [Xylariaceae sp. FL1651]|nr:hypothetical protein F5Y19DRAFT_469607 [Xylariaceae sp. FL1651]
MYLLYTLTFLVIISGTALYLTRKSWLHVLPDVNIRLPGSSYIYSRLPNSFTGDIEAGLSSSTFDLGANVESGDARAGLDDAAKTEILKIMKKRRMRFDEARRVYMEQRFSANGIGPDGRPRDPKSRNEMVYETDWMETLRNGGDLGYRWMEGTGSGNLYVQVKGIRFTD